MRHVWRALCLAIVLICLLPAAPSHAAGQSAPETISEGIDRVLEGVDLAPFDEALRHSSLTDEEGAAGLVRKLAMGETVLDGAGVVRLIGSLFASEAASSIQLVLRIVVLAALGGVMQQMRGAFGEDGVSSVGRFTILLLCLMPLVADLARLIQVGASTIRGMSALVRQASPILITLLAAIGGSASAMVFEPATAQASGIAVSLIADWVLPALLCASAFIAVDALSEKSRLSRLISLTRSACHWVIGVSFTLFLAVLAIQGTAASSFDGVSLRTAKFAVDQFVPVVGGMFADTMDVLIGCSLLVKNGLGIVGMVAMLSWALMPALRIAAAVGCYRLASAVLEPVGDAAVLRCLSDFASILTTLLISVLSVAAMFIVTIAMFVFSGNAIAMIR